MLEGHKVIRDSQAMTFFSKRRRLIGLGLLASLKATHINSIKVSGKPEPHGHDAKPYWGVNSAPLWREIQDHPDGQTVPGFLRKIDDAEFGLRPKIRGASTEPGADFAPFPP